MLGLKDLTDNELAMVQSLYHNVYGDRGDGIWSHCSGESKKPHGLSNGSVPGVIGSLVKKGLMYSDPKERGEPAGVIGLTPAGQELAAEAEVDSKSPHAGDEFKAAVAAAAAAYIAAEHALAVAVDLAPDEHSFDAICGIQKTLRDDDGEMARFANIVAVTQFPATRQPSVDFLERAATGEFEHDGVY